MPDPNAVERRLDQLNGLWGQFADHPTARVLRWQADADARRIIDVFLQLHTEHPAGLPDYFLPFDRPFRDETSYAADLLRAWREWFDAQKDDLIEESRDPSPFNRAVVFAGSERNVIPLNREMSVNVIESLGQSLRLVEGPREFEEL